MFGTNNPTSSWLVLSFQHTSLFLFPGAMPLCATSAPMLDDNRDPPSVIVATLETHGQPVSMGGCYTTSPQ